MLLCYMDGALTQKGDEQAKDIGEHTYEYAWTVVRHQAEEKLISAAAGIKSTSHHQLQHQQQLQFLHSHNYPPPCMNKGG